jgi:hypothetical protein
MIEADSYRHQNRPRELVSSNGFSVEYDPSTTDFELRDDIISYLGEYRFKIPRFNYELVYSDGKLRDSRRGEAMEIKAERSVKERVMRGESTQREAAEAIGLRFLDEQLRTAELGNSIVWASPPGAQEEGYGDYGFFYVGQIRRSIENQKEIQMSALRVEKPTMESYKRAFETLAGIKYEAKSPEDYLKFPVVIKRELPQDFVLETLSNNFSYEMSTNEKQVFDTAMTRLSPKIDEFIEMMKWATNDEKRRAFHALENYSLKIKKELEEGKVTVFEAEENFTNFVTSYGFEPPKVSGSCPIKSSGISSLGASSLNSFLENSEGFTCPKCSKKADGPVGNKCPNCGITKEEWAKQSHQVC